MAKARFVLFASMVAVVLLAQPVSAGGLTSTISDPAGDAFLWIPGGPAPGYLDIVGASVSLKDGRFVLSLNMAASIPASPVNPPGTKLLEWAWEFAADPTMRASGFPFGQPASSPTLYMVQILWDGTISRGQFIDRTPLFTGGEAVVTPLAFGVKGAEFTASVDATMIGSPSSFIWISTTRQWQADLGAYAWFPIDGAPDPNLGPASWPS